MSMKKIVASLVFPLTLAASSGSALAATFTGTIVNYDVNADAVTTPARLTCIQVQLTGTSVRQWGCVYANNRLASHIQNTYLQAVVEKQKVLMKGDSFDSNGALIIRAAEILP